MAANAGYAMRTAGKSFCDVGPGEPAYWRENVSDAPGVPAGPVKPIPNPSWSYSALNNFETCPKRYYHYNVAKDVAEPESVQQREGNDLHAVFDQRIKGTALPLGFGQFETMLASIIAAPGKTYSEQKLAITAGFQPAAYFAGSVWFRTIIDAAKVNGDRATVFDWKTGRPKADMTQLQLMSATIMAHMPAIMRVRAALVFVNHEKTERAEFTRNDLPEIWAEILPRVRKVQVARHTQEFPPKPSGLCKKYCGVLSCPHHGKG